MKRFIMLLCAITLIVLSISDIAMADSNSRGVNITFSSATDAELEEAIRVIQNELNSRAANKTKTKDSTKKISEIGVTKTNSDGISFTILSVKESQGSGWYTPEDGNTFVFLEVEIANNTNAAVSVNAIYSFDAICDDYTIDYSFSADCAVDNGISTTEIKSGRKLKGYKAFEVPKNWKELIVTFTPDYSIWGHGEEIEVFIYK